MKAILMFVAALAPATGLAASIGVSVDIGANVHPFNPLIFGVAFGDAAGNAQIGYSVDRWGGNSTTRYNWQVDVHNTASDYFYENIPDCMPPVVQVPRLQVTPRTNSLPGHWPVAPCR